MDYIKYLSMYIDKHLNAKFHIQQLSKKLSKAYGMPSNLRYDVPIETCL